MLDGEIISADSRQIYKYLDIGTAKPSPAERNRAPHHFIDVFEPSENYSAGQYGEDAIGVVEEVFARGKTPILVGGSGLYVKAVIEGLFEGPSKDADIRGRLEEQLLSEGIDPLLNTLRIVDPVFLAAMKEITPRRVIRALEVFYIAGRPLSQLHAEQKRTVEYGSLQVSLDWDRSELYSLINRRVDRMIEAGLVAEVESLQRRGFDKRLNSLNTVGYKEVFDNLAGITDADTMVELIKRNTRRFAKRQITWFGGDTRIHKFRMTGGQNLEILSGKIAEIYRRVAKT